MFLEEELLFDNNVRIFASLADLGVGSDPFLLGFLDKNLVGDLALWRVRSADVSLSLIPNRNCRKKINKKFK